MAERKYTATHEWIVIDGGRATIGITDFAQAQLGDVVFLELPKTGAKVAPGEAFGVIESVRRKPLNMRVLEYVQGACTVLIIGVIAYISFFDVQDWPLVKRVIDKYAPQSQKAKNSDAP